METLASNAKAFACLLVDEYGPGAAEVAAAILAGVHAEVQQREQDYLDSPEYEADGSLP